MSFSFGSEEKKQTSASKQDPWAPAVPYLTKFLDQVGNVGRNAGKGLTNAQKAAFGDLTDIAGASNPFVDEQKQLVSDLYNTQDRTGIVGDAYSTLQGQLSDYANGKYLDPMSNPQMQAMLQQVGDDAWNRTNAMFAGAGRDMSGANQIASSRGVTQAQLPLLLNEYARAQQMQMDAAGTLFGAGSNTATTMSNLDAQRADIRGQAAGAEQAAHDMETRGAKEIIDLEQMKKMLPYEELGALGSLLFPAGQMGKQTKSSGKSEGTSAGVGFNIFGPK
jgi:hypothetical protein